MSTDVKKYGYKLEMNYTCTTYMDDRVSKLRIPYELVSK